MVWPSQLPASRDVVGLGRTCAASASPSTSSISRLRPDVELAFLAFAVGIERGGEAAALGDHLAQQPADGLVDAARVELVAGLAVGLAHAGR